MAYRRGGAGLRAEMALDAGSTNTPQSLSRVRMRPDHRDRHRTTLGAQQHRRLILDLALGRNRSAQPRHRDHRVGLSRQVCARMPFPMRALQVDGGSEFHAAFEAECPRRALRLEERFRLAATCDCWITVLLNL